MMLTKDTTNTICRKQGVDVNGSLLLEVVDGIHAFTQI